jgi:hypothetical protein
MVFGELPNYPTDCGRPRPIKHTIVDTLSIAAPIVALIEGLAILDESFNNDGHQLNCFRAFREAAQDDESAV